MMSESRDIPLSYGQRALWFVQRLAPEATAYNFSVPVRVRGPREGEAPDIPALIAAWQALADRHPALRTTYPAPGGSPVGRVHDRMPIDATVVDASAWSPEELDRRLVEEAHRPFRLDEAPVVRLRLFRTGAEEVVTLVSLHHIAIDFSSLAVVLEELGTLYVQPTAQSTAQPPDQPSGEPPNRPPDRPPALPPLAATYEDFSRWQAEMLAGPRGEELWNAWRNRLADAPPVLELPSDRIRPRTQTFGGGALDVVLPESLIRGAKALAAAEGTDLGTLLLAAFQALLHRYTGRDDILVGCPVPGRPWPELFEVVGFFVSSVVVRSDFSGAPSFRAALARVRERAAEALAWQDYPFPLLVERLRPQRDPGVSPIFQVFFVLYQGQEERVLRLLSGQGGGTLRTGGLTLEPYPLGGRAAMFDLSLMMSESGDRVAATFQYNSDLFEAATVARIADDYAALLAAVLADPGQPVATLPASLGEARRSASARQVPPTAAPLPETDRSLDRADTRRALLERQKRLRSTTTQRGR